MRVVETARQVQASMYHAVGSAVVEVRKATHCVLEKNKTVATKAFNAILPPAKRATLRGQLQELKSKASACAHSLATSAREKATRAFRTISMPLEFVASSLQRATLRIDHHAHKAVSSILDAMIPSRREVRILKGRAECIERDAIAKTARLEEAARRICALELQIETLHSEQRAAVEVARPQALSPPLPAADAVVATDPVELSEGSVREDAEEIAAPARRVRKARPRARTNHAVKTPSLKVCLQGSGYPKRKH